MLISEIVAIIEKQVSITILTGQGQHEYHWYSGEEKWKQVVYQGRILWETPGDKALFLSTPFHIACTFSNFIILI